MTLYLFALPDCTSCAWAKKLLAQFTARHPEVDTRVVDVTAVNWESGAPGILPPEEFPAFAVQRPGMKPVTAEGRIFKKYPELERWVLEAGLLRG